MAFPFMFSRGKYGVGGIYCTLEYNIYLQYYCERGPPYQFSTSVVLLCGGLELFHTHHNLTTPPNFEVPLPKQHNFWQARCGLLNLLSSLSSSPSRMFRAVFPVLLSAIYLLWDLLLNHLPALGTDLTSWL